VEAASVLKGRMPDVRIVLLTMYDEVVGLRLVVHIRYDIVHQSAPEHPPVERMDGMVTPINASLAREAWAVFRFLLRETSAIVVTTILIGIGTAMIYGYDFAPGIACFVIAGLWGVAAWNLSDELKKQKPQPPKKQQYLKVQKYKQAQIKYLLWKFGISFLIFVPIVCGGLWGSHKREETILNQYQGFLLPADEPDPPSFCTGNDTALGRIGKDALKIFVGRNEAFSNHFPYVVLRVRNKDRIIMNRDDTGKIALTVDILDKQGRVIVTFENGHFTVLQANILDMRRPDRSTLIVRDQFKNEVLNVHYLNRRSIQFSAFLTYPEYGSIWIPKSSAVEGICVGGGGVAYAIE
jgi:hypothetical protein